MTSMIPMTSMRPRLVFATSAALLALGLVGHAGQQAGQDVRGAQTGSVQFLERGGSFYIHDVNLRLPASVAVSIKAGLDMPALAVLASRIVAEEQALRRPVAVMIKPDPVSEPEPERTFDTAIRLAMVPSGA